MVFAVFLSILIDLIGFGIILPLLPFYATSFGATPFTIAMLASIFSIAQFVMAPVLGGLSDRIGRKPVFLACTLISALAYLGLALADSLIMVFLARALSGIGAGKVGVAQAIIADATPPDQRARSMGKLGAAFGIGMILGPILGGLLTGPDPLAPNYALPSLAAAAASLSAFCVAIFKLPETLSSRAAAHASPNPLGNLDKLTRAAMILILVQFAIHFVFSQIETLFPIFGSDRFGWHAFEVGIAFTFIGVVVVTMQGGLIGPLTRRFGESNLLRTGMLLLALGTLMAAWVYSVPIMAISILFTSSGFALINASIASLISKAADPEHQGLTMGAAQSLSALARVVGPMFGGYLYEHVRMETPYIIGGLMLLATLGFSFRAIGAARR